MAVPEAQMQQWARDGASARLRELEAERGLIFHTFPELRGATVVPSTARRAIRRQAPAANGQGVFRRKRRFSAAAKKRMSAGMRKYWAAKRANKAARVKETPTDAAIRAAAIERGRQARSRGRRVNVNGSGQPEIVVRKRRRLSAAARRRIGDAARKMWADRRKKKEATA